MATLNLRLLLLLCFSFVTVATSYNVLLMMAFASRSHKHALDSIAEELAKRGHQVTTLSPLKETKTVQGVREIYMSKVAEEWQTNHDTFFSGNPSDPGVMERKIALCHRLCNATYHEPEVVQALANAGPNRYDILVIDGVFNDFLLPIAHHLGMPAILISPGGILATQAMGVNIPVPFAYLDSGIELVDYPMTFVQRAKSTFINLVIHHLRYTSMFPGYDQIIHEVLPNTPRIVDLERNISFIMSNTHPAVHQPRPTMPYYKEVACLHCKPANALPKVTTLSPLKDTKTVKGVREIYMSKVAEEWQKYPDTFFSGTTSDPGVMQRLVALCHSLCNATYHEPEVVQALANAGPNRYDVLIIDGVFNDFLLPIAHRLGIPAIVISPGGILATQAMGVNIPVPFSYLDSGIELVDWPMTFVQRAKSTFINLMMHHMRHTNMFSGYDQIIHKVLPNTPRIADLERNISLIMSNTHPAVHHPKPTMPYYKEVACLHCKPANALPKELEDFMQSSGKDGVIYFSLGSVTKGDDMPLAMREKIMEGFAKLPQKILWKYEKELEGLPKNIKLTKWAPQQDILEHNKTRLFITHGGGLSILEAVYHSCPILGFPLGAEQMGNIGRAVHQGYAEALLWRTFTAEEFLSKVKRMLKDKRYQQRVEQLSTLLKDQPEKPQEKAAYWIEYVVRHKGAPHLKSGAEDLNIFQYFLLDICAVLLLIVSAAALLLYLVIRKLWKLIFGSRPAPQTPKKKRN